MKRTVIFCMSFLLCMLAKSHISLAQEHNIEFFHGSWSELMAEAKAQNKPIFVDCFTTWCGPCKFMSSKVFTEPAVAEHYNHTFVNYKLDMEKGEGLDIAKQFNIHAYPTFLYLGTDGKLMHESVGARQGDKFVEEAKVAVDPQRNVVGLMYRYKKGDRDTAFLHRLISATQYINDSLGKVALTDYWKSVPLADLQKEANWNIFGYHEEDINSPQYEYVLANKSAFEDKFGKEPTDNAIYGKALDAMSTAAKTHNEQLLNKAKTVLSQTDDEEIRKYSLQNEANYYSGIKDWNNFEKLATEYVEKYANDDWMGLNGIAWEVYSSGTDSKSLLEKALDWAGRSVDIEKEYANTDTYAALLYSNGDYAKAEKAAQEAIELAKKEGTDYTSTSELLEKVRTKMKK